MADLKTHEKKRKSISGSMNQVVPSISQVPFADEVGAFKVSKKRKSVNVGESSQKSPMKKLPRVDASKKSPSNKSKKHPSKKSKKQISPSKKSKKAPAKVVKPSARLGSHLTSIVYRTTPGALAAAMATLSPSQKKLLRDFGLGSLIGFGIQDLHPKLVFFVVDAFDLEKMVIHTAKGDIKCDEQAVLDVFGLKKGSVSIYSEKFKADPDFRQQWLNQFEDPSGIRHTLISSLICHSQGSTKFLFTMNFLMLFWNSVIFSDSNGLVKFDVLDYVSRETIIANIDWCGHLLDSLKHSKEKWNRDFPLRRPYCGPAIFLTLLYLDRTKLDSVPVCRQRPIFRNWKESIKVRAEKEMALGQFGLLELAPDFVEEGDIGEGFVQVTEAMKESISEEKKEYLNLIEDNLNAVSSIKMLLVDAFKDVSLKFGDDEVFRILRREMVDMFSLKDGFDAKSDGDDDELASLLRKEGVASDNVNLAFDETHVSHKVDKVGDEGLEVVEKDDLNDEAGDVNLASDETHVSVKVDKGVDEGNQDVEEDVEVGDKLNDDVCDVAEGSDFYQTADEGEKDIEGEKTDIINDETRMKNGKDDDACETLVQLKLGSGEIVVHADGGKEFVEEEVDDDQFEDGEEAYDIPTDQEDDILSQWFHDHMDEIIEVCDIQLLVNRIGLPLTMEIPEKVKPRSITPPSFNLLSQDSCLQRKQKWLAPIEKAVTKLFHVYRKLDGDVSRLEERVEAISNDRQPPKVQTKMPTMSEFENEDLFEDRQLGDIYMEMPTTSEFAAEDTRHLHKEREITPPVDSVMPVLHDNGDEELLDVNQEHPESVENVAPMPNCALPRKDSSPRCDTICVQGYKVKQSDAPILEAIFKKHGDIAAECKFKVTSVRVSMLEVVCEVVRRVQNNEGVVKREEIEGQMSDIEAANFDVLWLRAHLEAIYKREAATKKSTLLIEMKGNAILVKRAAQMDLKERCAELVAVKERFKNGERCVKVLDLVEKNLNDNILESKAEDDLWAKEPILELLHEKVSSPRSGIISVRGYKVKEGVGRILEALFKKHGDIAAECVLKTASLRASFLEVVCDVVRRILTDDVTKIISEIDEIKSQVSDADAVNVNVSWIRAHLEAIHKRNEAMKKSTMLMEIKSTTTLVKQEAQKDLEERNAELVATQKRFEKAERCVKVLGLVETKLSNDILESKAEKDSWVEQPVL